MSLENAIQENTVAIRALIVALGNAQPVSVEPATTFSEHVEQLQQAIVFPETIEPAEPIPYETVAAAITNLVKVKGRDAGLAVLKSFGVAKGPELKPEQYAAVIAACEAA